MEKENYTTIEQVKSAIKNLYYDMKETFNNSLEGITDFRVYDIQCSVDYISVSLAIYLDEEKEEIARWNILKLRLEEDIYETGNGRKFTSNIGTTGEFDLDDNSKGSRNNFYIQVGKVLGNESLMGTIYDGLMVYGTAIREQRSRLKNLRENG